MSILAALAAKRAILPIAIGGAAAIAIGVLLLMLDKRGDRIETLEAEKLAVELACKLNTDTLESEIASQSARIEALGRETSAALLRSRKSNERALLASSARETAIADFIARPSAVPEDAVGKERELLLCRENMDRLLGPR